MPWGKETRRTKGGVLPKHESTLDKARVILLTRLVTDDGAAECGTPINPWLDAHRNVYAKVMLDAWSEAREISPLPARSHIELVPCTGAARYVSTVADRRRPSLTVSIRCWICAVTCEHT
jgi:hypothetical protein